MVNKLNHKEEFIKGLSILSGIKESKIREYGRENSLLNIVERPYSIKPTTEQLKKLLALNEFIGQYHIVRDFEVNKKTKMNNPKIVAEYLINLIGRKKDREVFMGLFLDTKNQIIESRIFSEGTANASIVDPKIILKQALACDCQSVIFAHNHPSGIVKPSREDINAVQRLVDIFNPIGIKVLDHIIVGNNNYHSAVENGDHLEIRSRPNYNKFNLATDMLQDNSEDEWELEL